MQYERVKRAEQREYKTPLSALTGQIPNGYVMYSIPDHYHFRRLLGGFTVTLKYSRTSYIQDVLGSNRSWNPAVFFLILQVNDSNSNYALTVSFRILFRSLLTILSKLLRASLNNP